MTVGESAELRHPHQPADLEPDERAECSIRVEIGAARVAVGTPHLGKAERNQRDDECGKQECGNAERADGGIQHCRNAKDPGADDPVDGEQGKVAPAEHALEC